MADSSNPFQFKRLDEVREHLGAQAGSLRSQTTTAISRDVSTLETDVESVFTRVEVERFLLRCEQVKKQGSKATPIQRARNKLITRTVPTTPTAMREENKRSGVVRYDEIPKRTSAPEGIVLR